MSTAYRKLDPIEGRAPKLYVTAYERGDTDRDIRKAIRYCKSDSYLAFAFGVEPRRVAVIREDEGAKAERRTDRNVDNGEPGSNEESRFRLAAKVSCDHHLRKLIRYGFTNNSDLGMGRDAFFATAARLGMAA